MFEISHKEELTARIAAMLAGLAHELSDVSEWEKRLEKVLPWLGERLGSAVTLLAVSQPEWKIFQSSRPDDWDEIELILLDHYSILVGETAPPSDVRLVGEGIHRRIVSAPGSTREFTSVPVLSDSELLGLLSVIHEEAPSRRSGYEETILAIASLLGLFLRNVLAQIQEQKDRAEIERLTCVAEQRSMELEAILHAFPDLYFWMDENCTVLSYHFRSDTDIETVPSHLIGKRMQDALTPGTGSEIAEACRKALDNLSITQVEYTLPTSQGEQSYEARIVPVCVDRALMVVRNITARRQAEKALKESHSILEAVTEHIPEGIAIIDAESQTIRLLSEYASDLTGAPRETVEGMTLNDYLREYPVYHLDGVTQATSEEMPLYRASNKVETISDEEWVLRRPDGEVIPILVNAAPVRDRGNRVIAAVVAFRDNRAQRAAREHLESAYRRERHIADVLQQALLPIVARDLPRFQVSASYWAASKEAEVGGDFYDAFDVEDGRLALVMGDVSGKGLDAAVHTAMAKNMLRGYAYENSEPASVLERLNNVLHQHTAEELFITLFYGVFDTSTGFLTYTNAGHDPPLHYHRETESSTELGFTGGLAGVTPGMKYNQGTLQLAAGDILALYTDGITDARSEGKFFGIEGLADVLKSNSELDSKAIIQVVYDAASKAADGNMRDDAAVLVVKGK